MAAGGDVNNASDSANSSEANEFADGSHQITEINDLKNICDNDFQEAFWNNRQVVFSYALQDVLSLLDSRTKKILQPLRNHLCKLAQETFVDLQDKVQVNRRGKNPINEDIFHLGYSLVNNAITKEAEKLFTKKDNAVKDDQAVSEDNPTANLNVAEFAKMVVLVAELKQRLEKVEAQCKQLADNCCCKKGTEQAATPAESPVPSTSNSSVNAEQVDRPDPPLTSGSDEDTSSSSSSDESSSSESSHDESDTQILNLLLSKKKRKQKKTKTAKSASDAKVKRSKSEGQSEVRAAKPPKQHIGPKAQNTVKAASKTSVSNKKTEVYIGNLDPENSAADLQRHLEQKGVSVALSDFTSLRRSTDSQSFRISIPSSKFEIVAGSGASTLWPKGVKARIFHPKKADSGPQHTARRNQGHHHRRTQHSQPTSRESS